MRARPLNALVCAPELPEPLRQSGSRRLYHFIELMLELEMRVSVVSEDTNPADQERLQQLGVPVFREQDLDELLAATNTDIALIAFWYLAERCIPVFRDKSPGTALIVDSIDLHFVRTARHAFGQRQNGDSGELGSSHGSEMARELNVYAEADLVLAVSEKEATTINDLLNQPRALSVPDGEDFPKCSEPFGERNLVLFIGNFRHPPNGEALEFLCTEIIPRLDPRVLSSYPVAVVGNALGGDSLELCKRVPGVEPIGFVPEVVPYLARSRVVVAPLLHGAGTKRKLIQALLVGTPAVATSIAAEGLEATDGEGLVIADHPDAFAAAVSQLVLDEEHWSQLAYRGRERLLLPHGREDVRQQLAHALEQAVERAGGQDSGGLSGTASAATGGADPELGAMKRDWDQRARSNAMHYIASGKEEWDEAEFFENGKRSVQETVLTDLDLICGDRDPQDMRMLEIGCGIGRMTRHLAGIFREVHGVDISGEMIGRGREKLADLPNVFLTETDGSDLQHFPEGFFDFAYSFIVFQHIPAKEVITSYFREVRRTLKPGCLFKFQVQGGDVPDPDTWLGAGFTETELQSLAKEIGFTSIRTEGAGRQYFWSWWVRD
jgi:ubiquinone/menaquinone biosynthesis C-methylase UbiE/glycosyltransferase involved in cell wall biosynthesis